MKKQLPPRPNLEQLKKQAKTLLKGYQASDTEVFRRVEEHHPRWQNTSDRLTLSDAQLVLAREYGFASWATLRKHVLSKKTSASADAPVEALIEAASSGDVSRVTQILDAHPEIIDERGGSGTRTALHFAAMGLREPLVRFLLERGADPNVLCEGDSATPLHFAAEKEHLGIIRLLVEHGADPIGEGDYHELGVIGWATCFAKGDKEVVDYLTTHGAQHNIFSAVAMGEVAIIRRLAVHSRGDLEKRMDLTNKRRRPMHLAVVKKRPESLAVLLELGANTESLDEAGLTPLDQAALSGETDMAQILLGRGAKVRLPAAVALQRTSEVERLLRREPECLRPGKRWGNLIVRASESSPGHVVESLIRAGASVDVRDDPKTAVDSTSGYTALHGAAFFGNADAASVLLKHGASVRVRDEKYHGTPAGWANYAGHAAVRDLILRGPIDIFEAIDRGLASRIAGILEREPEALDRRLGEYLGDPAWPEGWRTPLAWAVAVGNTEAVRVLIDQGADRVVRSPDGRTLLQIAQEKGYEEIRELLAGGAET